MNLMEKKATFGLIVGTRGFFNPVLANGGRKQLLAKLEKLGYNYVIPSENATPNGAIETLKDARICAELFQAQRKEIDGIIVVLPNFGDELGVVQTLELAKLNVPVLVQACDDDLDKVDVAHRRDAFCGKLSVCNNLYQYGIPFTDTLQHTCAIDSDEFTQDLDRFARVCRVVKGLTSARVGAIGARPAAFQTVRFSEKLLQSTGITVVPVDLSEILAAAQALNAQESAVQEKLAVIRAYGTIPARIPAESIERQAKLSVAIDRFMAENELDASAVQCWESVQKNYGCATCLSMSLMGERFLPSACEVDVTGAVSMYALLLASGQIPGFLDWNNNYGADREKCVNTHCSNYPKSFMGNAIEISELDILGETLGREKCFGAIKGHVAAGPMTYFRMDTDDRNGTLRAYLGEGAFTDDPFAMDGGIAVCQIPNLRKLLGYMCQNGFEHHVAMTRTHCADVLEEAVTKYLRWELYRHE
ncbi:L-fucose isomerase [Candidatus Moduliflexus flocculans]|uniref:L-fucose isomerase n=1 Tax=Candidatus Moduliflexus flocculans TaxID=1499966 RepID=A0A0S6W383_9BACT|nr:L-fucose isomerase [Candidatus Moduliflexus flocculans]